MSQETINKSLQKTLISPLTHDSLWSQFLNSMSYELQNMRDEYSKIKNNWNIDENDKSNLIRISESFGYTPNLIINNTINMAKKEIESIPYKIREKTNYLGYNLIFQQNNSLGEVFHYYWNNKKLIKIIDYEKTITNLINSNHYSPFLGIATKKNYSSTLNSDVPLLDYTLNNGEKQYDPDTGLRYYSLDQIIAPSIWKLDTSYIQIPTKHLGIEYFPQNYYCIYTSSLGIADEETSIYESQIEKSEYYIEKSMTIKINDIILDTSIEISENKEYFIDENGILNSNSYFDVKNNLIHLEFNKIPSNYEISVSYNIDLMMTSDYFYYLERGMEYNRRCPIIPHSGIFLSVDIVPSRGSDFYYQNENNYTIPDLKIKAITASSYNRFITLTDASRLDNAWDEQGQPTSNENYKLDSLIKWTLDSKTTEKKELAKNFKYIAYGNKPLNIINEKNIQIFNQNSIIFYYNLNSEDYSHTIYDCSSNQINCTVIGDDLKINSIIDKSLDFNGETYAYSNTALAIDSSQDYTLGLWFKALDSIESSIGTIFNSFINISYDYSNNKLIIDEYEFDCDRNYHFLCLQFNYTSNTVNVYIDSIDYGQFNFTLLASSYTIYLGTNDSLNDNFYGEIDNIWLLAKILTDTQMSYIFDNKISMISHMGNRLSYYELTDDEIYDDNDNYLLVQSYVKSMDINNEKTMLVYNSSDSANYTYATKFSPIIPSYFKMSYTDSLGKTITIKSNEDGKFYNEDTGKTITGGIDFDKGVWNLTKNTIQSISQKPIVEINKEPYKKTYSTLYHVINESAVDPSDKDCWYSTYDVKTQSHGDKIVADEYNINGSTKTIPTFIYKSNADTSLTDIYSNDEENLYVYINGEKSNYINLYNVGSDDAETSLFSKDNGKTLYLDLSSLISETNQIKAYADLGEASATTIYSKDNGMTMYLDVACSSDKQIHKYYTTVDNNQITFYTLGTSQIGYSNLSFTSIVKLGEESHPSSFNPMQLVIKTVQSDLISTLSLYYDIHEYTNVYTLDYIQSFQVSITSSNTQLVKNSIVFYFWMNKDGVLTKKSANIDAQGGISGDNINALLSNFDYNTNILYVTFYNKVDSDIIVSYEYYYSLDIDYSKPIIMNYKIQKSIMVNEIGLEDENHELMAYMTFPNIEFHTIYDNISALFAISKQS